ncbi:DUF357 domain-containing protein [Candidatus Aerophobetes bacterium]|uniref:DUF357 domain-containing protein n=1 Tax=Aerophobetes bacterium TaxID=2030807 RepID=A0A662D2J8_UNCAE|nr:MAG: DUF357 domain-containing protein [Candidatus Aerophobetes bacterium]
MKRLEEKSEKIKKIKYVKGIDECTENIRAYISDCKYFLEKNDLINAFEAIVYAWGIYETLERLGLIE